jgi:RNA 3'-terminal phosphate cyclase (ATP)
VRRGYYPRGGGVVRVDIRPFPGGGAKLFPPLRLAECRPIALVSIRAFHAGGCPPRVAQEMASGAAGELERAWGESPRFRDRFSRAPAAAPAIGGGCGGGPAPAPPPIAIRIVRDADCAGSGSGVLLVAHPEDALPPSVGELTLHTRTAMWVAERMTGCEFEVERVDGSGGGGEVDAWRGGEGAPAAAATAADAADWCQRIGGSGSRSGSRSRAVAAAAAGAAAAAAAGERWEQQR